MQSLSTLLPSIQNKKILFITTKNLSYIRNVQEINLINLHAESYHIIGSSHKSYLVRLIKVYWALLTTSLKDFDIVWIGFAPQLILPAFRHKLKKADIEIIVDFFISLFDTLCWDRKKIKPNSLFGKILHYIDKNTLSHADAIICDTNAHGQYFVKEFGIESCNLYTLYLQADKSVYHPMTVTRPNYLNEKFVVLYFGSVLPLQGIDIVLEAMNILKDQKELYFYFIGPIKGKKLIAAKPISENIKYINWLGQKELAMYINYSDLCLAGHFSSSIDKAKRTIPGKAYIYHAIKKPMILGDNPANHELFNDYADVAFVEMGNARALAHAILNFAHLSTDG